ncbi:MAG: DUF445 family protein [Candidatus Pseudobacter hemicellulosilyticus]|uniref:DUF445 family protein n=1 Tax=Candidatus Pseudobacter hemicellulosilyticus TaxID=3121375 RepID=A0AAJ5WRL7_9BACT|nr:MAG: DUF445 family protein [Pseudobacter sp.]
MNWWLLIIPVVSALVGWLANRAALKLLFHPRYPVRILGVTVQGIFPKRQQAFADRVGKLVNTELLSFTELEHKITSQENLQKVMPTVETHIDHFLSAKLPVAFPMISMFIGEKTISQLKEIFMKELEEIFPNLMKSYMSSLQQELDLEKIVTARIAAFPPEKLEAVLYEVMSREFRLIRLFGAALGFLIGVFQVLFYLATS